MGAAPFYVPNGSARGVQLLHVLTNTCYFKKADSQDFPGGPVVKNLSFYCRGAQVQCPVGKLRFLMLRDEAEKKKDASHSNCLENFTYFGTRDFTLVFALGPEKCVAGSARRAHCLTVDSQS